MRRAAALGTAVLLAMRRATFILMLAILCESGRDSHDKAENRGRNKKFAHQIRPLYC
jgi:hypothetical protein